MNVYEIWVNDDDTQVTMFPGDTLQYDLLTKDVYDRPMVCIASFAASSWTRAKEFEKAIMEW